MTSHRRVLQSFSFALLLLFVSAGCSDEEPAPEESGEPQQEQAVAAEVPDSIEVLDDERSLERRIDDAAIAAQVRIALVDERELRQYNFDPVVVNGQVMLRGEVETQQERNRAEAVARDVGGVRDVMNEITALQQPVTEQPDTAESDAQDQLAEAQAPDTETETESPDASTADAPQGEDTADQEEEAASQEEATYHTVRSGESLWTISRRHGVSIDQIRRLNDLSGNNLRPGQRLRVK